MEIIDMHCDTISRLWEVREQGLKETLWENKGHIDIKRMKESGYLVQNFALFIDKEKYKDVWERVNQLLYFFQEEIEANKEYIAIAKNFADILENKKKGKISALLTVEEGAVCKGELEKLHILYEKGVRMLTLTWNYVNELGSPNLNRNLGKEAWGKNQELKKWKEEGGDKQVYQEIEKETEELLNQYLNTADTEHGLTEKGREFVIEMEKIGMIPDVSHLSDAGFYDVLECTKKPFVASHSNARQVSPCVRNLTDDMIYQLANRGGVMGLNFCADFLTQTHAGKENPGTLDAVVQHVKHIVKVGGIEVLGLGSDFDGIDTNKALPGAESMIVLAEALKKGGFTPLQIDKIMGKNVLRLYKEVL